MTGEDEQARLGAPQTEGCSSPAHVETILCIATQKVSKTRPPTRRQLGRWLSGLFGDVPAALLPLCCDPTCSRTRAEV